MQQSILRQAKVAEFGADHMEGAGPVSNTVHLVGQPGKMVNFTGEKISVNVEPVHIQTSLLSTSPTTLVSGLAHFDIIRS